MIAEGNRLIEILQAKSTILQLIEAKVVRDAAGREDEIVEWDRAILGQYAATLEIQTDHRGHPEADVGNSPKDPPDWIGNLFRLEAGRGHLIEKRLETVVIVTIDNQDVGLDAGQSPGDS